MSYSPYAADTIKEKYPLYAITNSKKLAKQFKAERDMSKFFVKSSEEDEEDWADFANRNNSEILKLYKLNTMSDEKNEHGLYIKRVKVLMTYSEYLLSTNDNDDESGLSEIIGQAFDEQVPSPYIFNKKYKELLIKIKYAGMYQLYVEDAGFEHWSKSFTERAMNLYANDESPDEYELVVIVDEVKNFVESYSDLFR